MTNQSGLVLENVSKSFKTDVFRPRSQALTNVSCKFNNGQCTGLLGHNGAGKTTTIRLILDLMKPDSGQITFQNQKITVNTRRLFGFMPEVNKLPSQLTAYEVLSYHDALFHSPDKSSRKTRVLRYLEYVGLIDATHKKVAKMSKGMQRRLAWALATIHQPKLLILDEPFSGLDPVGRDDMKRWISEQKSFGTTIILCTHDLSHLSLLCDEIVILNHGKVVYTSANSGLVPLTQTEPKNKNNDVSYIVEVSGTVEEELEQIVQDYKLNPWIHIKNSGYKHALTLNSYQDCAAYLAAFIRQGLIVTLVDQSQKWNTNELLQYFSLTNFSSPK